MGFSTFTVIMIVCSISPLCTIYTIQVYKLYAICMTYI
ncbi:hypothetical protein [Sulfolobus spindle-shaped virus]|nr:hypothetical protein [Sulfolobus spindle-shaped virus]AZG03105.1 hypothetical protein [Sulfolobus spindle-shaped virus]AZG03383.1 hypothetical protein [Sulfolobus spindle-shaped virus]